MADIQTLNDGTFNEAISGDKPVLVDFWAEWCGPCRVIAPVLEELAEEQEGFSIGKLNVDHNPQTAAAHDVMSIPTLILFKEGTAEARLVGAKGKNQLIEEISPHL